MARKANPQRKPASAPPTQPYRGGVPNAAGQTGLSVVPRISIVNHEVDPLRVYQHLTGKEADVDEHTGSMYPARSEPGPGAVHGEPGGAVR